MGTFLSRRWRVQPTGAVELDLRHPMVQGMAVLVNAGYGPRVVNLARPSAQTGVKTLTGTKSGFGYVNTNGNTGYAFTGPAPTTSSTAGGDGDLTVFALAIPVASSTRQFFWSSAKLSGVEAFFGVNIDTSLSASSGTVSFVTNTGGAIGYSMTGVADSKPHLFMVTRSLSNALYSGYSDGVPQGTAFYDGRPIWESGNSDYVLGYASSGWGTVDPVLMVGTANRCWSVAEAKELAANPWQLFRPIRQRVYVATAASANNSIAVPAASLVLTAQTPTVAQTAHQNVAVPAASLTLTAQTPTVTATAHQSIAVPLALLTLTGLAPTITGIDVPSSNRGAGSANAGKKRRYQVQIDDKVYEFRTEQQAIGALQRAHEVARKAIREREQAAKQVVVVAKPEPVTPPTIVVPDDSAAIQAAAEETNRKIAVAYAQAQMRAEAIYAAYLEQEDEDEAVSMLLH